MIENKERHNMNPFTEIVHYKSGGCFDISGFGDCKVQYFWSCITSILSTASHDISNKAVKGMYLVHTSNIFYVNVCSCLEPKYIIKHVNIKSRKIPQKLCSHVTEFVFIQSNAISIAYIMQCKVIWFAAP